MAIWQWVLIGLGALILIRFIYKGISRWLMNRSMVRRMELRIHELRQMGYTNEDFYIDTKFGIPVVRLYEDKTGGIV